MPHFSPPFPEPHIGTQAESTSVKRLVDLGFIAGKRVNLYGEQFEIASVPFIDGAWVAVRVISDNDPTIQTIRLPVSILLGLAELLPTPVS